MVFIIITILSAGVGLGSAIILQLRAERNHQVYQILPRFVELEAIPVSETSLHNH